MPMVRMSDGAELFVKIIGGDDAAKPLMIVHHGGPGVSNHAEPAASFGFLADRFRILAFDARGSGQSALKPPFTHARWAADVDELRRWAGAERHLMAGGSYGGIMSLEYALRYPDHVAGLILCNTTAYGPAMREAAIETLLKLHGEKLTEDLQRRMWAGHMKDDEEFAKGFTEIVKLYTVKGAKEPAADSALEAVPFSFHAATHNWAFTQNIPVYDVRKQLGDIRVPTLVVSGRHDWVTPVPDSEVIAAGIPGARLVIFENSGHAPSLEETEKFQATVREFLATSGIG